MLRSQIQNDTYSFSAEPAVSYVAIAIALHVWYSIFNCLGNFLMWTKHVALLAVGIARDDVTTALK